MLKPGAIIALLSFSILCLDETFAEKWNDKDHVIERRSLPKATKLVGFAMEGIAESRFQMFPVCAQSKINEFIALLRTNKELNMEIIANWKKGVSESKYTEETLSILNTMASQLSDIEMYASYSQTSMMPPTFDLNGIKTEQKRLLAKSNKINDLENMVSMTVKSLLIRDPCAQTLTSLTAMIKDISAANEKLVDLKNAVDKYGQYVATKYNKMYNVLLGDGLNTRLKHLYHEVKISKTDNETKSEIMIPITEVLISNSMPDVKERIRLLKTLSNVIFPGILKYFRCNEDLGLFLKSLVADCAKGSDKFELIYARDFTRRMKHCKKKLNKQEVSKSVQDLLNQQGRHLRCLRNGKQNKQLVCMYQRRDKSGQEIEQLTGFPLKDIAYFKNDCAQVSVPSSIGEIAICAEKSRGRYVFQVEATFKHWNAYEISAIYNTCKLSKLQISHVCELKHQQKMNFQDIHKKYNLYPENYVKNVYNTCEKPIDVLPSDRGSICTLYFAGKSMNSSALKIFRDKYSLETLKAVTKDCKRPTLQPVIAERICFMKHLGKSPNHSDYKKMIMTYGKVQVVYAFLSCKIEEITYGDRTNICKLNKTEASYKTRILFYEIRYSKASVAKTLSSCEITKTPKVKLTMSQKISICQMKSAGLSLESNVFNYFRSSAGADAVKDVYINYCTSKKRNIE